MGLLLVDAPGQGRQLLHRRALRERQSWTSVFTNLLAIRLPGVDPEPALRWLYPKVRWIFSPLVLGLALMACDKRAVALVLGQFVVIRAKLPRLSLISNAEQYHLAGSGHGGSEDRA